MSWKRKEWNRMHVLSSPSWYVILYKDLTIFRCFPCLFIRDAFFGTDIPYSQSVIDYLKIRFVHLSSSSSCAYTDWEQTELRFSLSHSLLHDSFIRDTTAGDIARYSIGIDMLCLCGNYFVLFQCITWFTLFSSRKKVATNFLPASDLDLNHESRLLLS